MDYRKLTTTEIEVLSSRGCTAESWDSVKVATDFNPERLSRVRMSGHVALGSFNATLSLAGGVKLAAGIYNVILHNVTIGNDCLIENVHNYIANYEIGSGTIIRNVSIIVTDGLSRFGNDVEVSVLNETGGRQVMINDKLSAHTAYIMALYRHRPQLAERLAELSKYYADKHASNIGTIGKNVTILNSGRIENVRIGDGAVIRGASRLSNGTISSTVEAPIKIGHNVIADDFIILSGSEVDSGAMLSRCFVGQACALGHGYSASDSLFFSNCQGENGEACAIFAGPFTVTHHKSTLLIAGMFSFMNAGSGSNQSNHMYKLGPIHQGILERGSKTSSDSYVLWPARIGAFSLVMGRHVSHPDTTHLPFSYLIEDDNNTYIVPGVNLRSVGTIRDAQKWPRRDKRPTDGRLDFINYNLLSPYTIQKMFTGRKVLRRLLKSSGELSDEYTYFGAKIKNKALHSGIRYYEIGITKFLGNSIIKRLEKLTDPSDEAIRAALRPDTEIGHGEWVDISGLIAPKSEIDHLLDGIEDGTLNRLHCINAEFQRMADNYYTYEWTWAYDRIGEFFGIDMEKITAADVVKIVEKWREAVVGLDRMVYDDARKEFSLAAQTGFGADGDKNDKEHDFEQVRGDFDNNPFVTEVLAHIERKTALGNELIARLKA